MKKLLKQICIFIAVIFILSEVPALNVYAAESEIASNDSMSTATKINLNKEYIGNIESRYDKDYYKVEITSDGEVAINFKHELIPGDSNNYWTIKVLDSDENVYMSYDVQGNEDIITLKRGVPKGTYYVLVDRYFQSYSYYYNTIDYNLSVTLKSSNYYEKEFNNDMSLANLISLNKKYTGKISHSNDKDYYKVIIPNDGEVSLNFNHEEIPGDSNNYWTIKLLDSYENEYMSYNVQGNEDSITLKRGLPKGTYYVLVDRYFQNYSYYYDTMDYNLSVKLKVSNYYEKEFNNSMSSADSIELGKKYTGKISDWRDYDYYKVQIPNNATVTLNFNHKKEVGETQNYWIIKLLDSKNNVYMERSVAGDEGNISLSKELSKGTYYVLVDTYYENYTRYYNTSDYNISVDLSIKSIKLNKISLSLDKGKTSTLTTTIAPSNATNKNVAWTSSNTKVATVDANGKVTAVGVGTANITAKAKDGSGKTAICKVTVKDPIVKVTSINLNKTSLSLEKGKTSTLITTIAPSNATNKNVTWTSSNTKVATVDANGKVTAVSAGTANITAKAKDGSGKTAICKVTVKNPVKVTSIKLNKTSLSLEKGKAATLTKTISPSNASNKNVTWTSSNTKVAKVDTNGKVTAVGVGTATITAKAKDGSGKTAICKVTVKNPTIKVTSLKLSKTSLSLQKGKTATLTATAAPSNATNKKVTWVSSNTKVATVDANGKIKAVGVGTADIICLTSDGSNRSAVCKMTVKK